MHFGKALEQLRLSRGLSQDRLAAAAGLNGTTVQRAEAHAKCPMRPSNVVAVTQALEKALPFTEDEARLWTEATGIANIVRRHEEIVRAHPHIPPLVDALNRMPADQANAHHWLATLIDELGIDTMLSTLRAVAASHNVDLRPWPTAAQRA